MSGHMTRDSAARIRFTEDRALVTEAPTGAWS